MAIFPGDVALGQNSWVVCGEETSYAQSSGSAATPSANILGTWIDQNGDNLDEESNRIESDAVAPLGSAKEYSVLGTLNAKGSLVMEVPISGFEVFLKFAFGAWLRTGAGPYQHDFYVSDLINPKKYDSSGASSTTSFTLWVNRGVTVADQSTGATWKYWGGLVNSIEFALSKGKNLTATVDMLFAGAAPVTGSLPVSPTFASGTDLGYFNYAYAQFAYTGSANLKVYDWRLKIDNMLDADHFMTAPGTWDMRAGSGGAMNPWRQRAQPLRNRKIAVTSSFTSEFDRMDIYNDWAANNFTITQLIAQNPAGTRTLNITQPAAANATLVTQYKPQITNEGKIMAKTEIKHYRTFAADATHGGLQNELMARLTNGNKLDP